MLPRILPRSALVRGTVNDPFIAVPGPRRGDPNADTERKSSSITLLEPTLLVLTTWGADGAFFAALILGGM